MPLPVKLIANQEIIKSSSSRLSDILEDQPGIFILPDFGGGNGIQIQGLDSQYTLLLIDGSPIIGRQSGTLDLDRISIGNIEQIEIIKGSSSSLYGTDAIGGVVNLITSKTNDSISADVSYKTSTFNTNDFSVNIGKISNKGHNLNLYFNSFNSDGYNLNDDPEERNNVYDKFPEIASKMEKLGEKEREELGDNLTGFKGKENRKAWK